MTQVVFPNSGTAVTAEAPQFGALHHAALVGAIPTTRTNPEESDRIDQKPSKAKIIHTPIVVMKSRNKAYNSCHMACSMERRLA